MGELVSVGKSAPGVAQSYLIGVGDIGMGERPYGNPMASGLA